MFQPGFDYQQFLTSLKIYAVETISTVVVLVLLLDLTLKELHPALKGIGKFWGIMRIVKKREER